MDARPRQPVQHGSEDVNLGTVVTATSNQAFYSRQQESQISPSNGVSAKQSSNTAYPMEGPPSMQSIMLNTAAGLGTEMAKGVWTGLKGLSTAAINGASRSETLSKGAPTFSNFAQRYVSPGQNGGVGIGANTRSNAPVVRLEDPTRTKLPQMQSRFKSGSWIKVLDLGRRQSHEFEDTCLDDPNAKRRSKQKLSKATIIAHFALPAKEVITMPHSTIRPPGVDVLSFAPGGTTLALGTSDGRSSFVVEIRPAAMGILAKFSPNDEPTGAVWVRYELRRGVTPAIVEKIEWSACGGWIGVGTRRTIHIFAIHPLGGRVSALQIRSSRPLNPDHLPTLSAKVCPVLRIRRPRGIVKRPVKASTPPSPTNSSNPTDTSYALRKSAYRVPARPFCFGPSVSTHTEYVPKRKAASSGVIRTVDVFDPIKRILRSEAVYPLYENQAVARSGSEAVTPPKEEEYKLASLTFRAWKVPSDPYHLYVSRRELKPPSAVERIREASKSASTSATAGTTPASCDGHLHIDGEAGILFERNEEGINEPEDMSTGSTSGDTRDDEWDDDLVTGAMDDEWHSTVPSHPHTKGMNRLRENDSTKKQTKHH
ncbi:hypothetical protein QFC19_002659 [Naganishia cerealis]|uniref:Uncharacterized protein n=1 Tax=Naganishia cerealis TaxID=610337 RepID=A0ACC2W924_9TREE|nr:hypothetical protein QFC19_002659 [Naganishia cerealis]